MCFGVTGFGFLQTNRVSHPNASITQGFTNINHNQQEHFCTTLMWTPPVATVKKDSLPGELKPGDGSVPPTEAAQSTVERKELKQKEEAMVTGWWQAKVTRRHNRTPNPKRRQQQALQRSNWQEETTTTAQCQGKKQEKPWGRELSHGETRKREGAMYQKGEKTYGESPVSSKKIERSISLAAIWLALPHSTWQKEGKWVDFQNPLLASHIFRHSICSPKTLMVIWSLPLLVSLSVFYLSSFLAELVSTNRNKRL